MFDECISDIKDHIFDDKEVDKIHLQNCVLNVINEYKRVHKQLLFMASCHAGTAEYDGTLKSTSATRRERFASICEQAVAMIDGDYTAMGVFRSDTKVDYVRDRCEKAAKSMRDLVKKPK